MTTTTVPAPPPISFRIIAIVLILWGAMGCAAAWFQLGTPAETLPEPDRTIMAGLPGWLGAVYVGAVVSGLAGGVALLLRRAIARPLFIVSLVLVVIQFGYTFFGTDLLALKSAAETVPFPLFIIAVAVFQVWYAGYALKRGWIA